MGNFDEQQFLQTVSQLLVKPTLMYLERVINGF